MSPAPSPLLPGFYEVMRFALLDAVMFYHATGPETMEPRDCGLQSFKMSVSVSKVAFLGYVCHMLTTD